MMEAHRLGTLLKQQPWRLTPRQHSYVFLPHVPTPPPCNSSTSTCKMPHGTGPTLVGSFPCKALKLSVCACPHTPEK